jgi:nucleotide-binding universal stress UspA family protein
MEIVMKNIVVLMHDDSGQEARFQAALDVVRAVEGHLTCVDVAILPVLLGDFYSGAGEIMLLDDERTRESANRTNIEERLKDEGVNWDWVETTGTIAVCLAEQAALADLIVVNRKLDSFPVPDMRSAAGETLMRSARPILAVPDGARGVRVAGKVLVCWDGSPCCIAAVRAAVPLLALADEVALFVVDDGSVAVPVDDAATYLSRHGIKTTIHNNDPQGELPEDLILRAIRHFGSDYVVMGGFSHSRLVEALLGGVTRAMLSTCPVPVFLAH